MTFTVADTVDYTQTRTPLFQPMRFRKKQARPMSAYSSISARQHPFTLLGNILAAVTIAFFGAGALGPSSWLASVDAQGGIKLPRTFGPRSGGGFGSKPQKAAAWSATYKLMAGTDEGVLEVEAVLSGDWHVFSTTQQRGGPLPTEIDLVAPKGIQLTEPFKPDHEPTKSQSDVFEGVTIEEFHGAVVWTAPIVLPPGYQGDITVKVLGQTCSDAGMCTPVRETLVAKFAGETQPTQTVADAPTDEAKTIELEFAQTKPYREPKNPVMWTAVASQSIPAGETGAIQFTATPDSGFHVYTSAVDDASSSTNFVVTQKSGLKIGTPTTPAEVILDNKIPSLPLKYHHGKVTWSLPVSIPVGTPAGEHSVEGFIVYQACTENACHPPAAMKFKTTIAVGDSGNKGTAVMLTAAKRAIALDAAAETKWVDGAAGKVAKPQENDQSMAPPAPDAQPPVPKAQPPEPDPSQSAGITFDAPPMDLGPSDTHASADESNHGPPPAPFIDSDSVAAGSAIASTVVKDSPEAIAEMAKLYDPNEKISYLTLADMDANPVGSGGVSSNNQTTFWSAMFGAFVGGMILNLMPCVFPVLGLKVMGFVKQAGSDPAKIRMHGIAFAAGLVVAMWVLAGIILAIKLSLGQDINWGAQMGNPYFVCSMIVLLFLLGLNMAGVFEFGTSMTRVGGTVQGKEGYTSSFLSGVLTTLVATPCSGPFLGAAMSYTLAQPAGIAMILFTVFALGIAVPYLLLCFFPALINKLPRPGAWMETFKVTMAFALFATVAFFMQAFGNQTGVGGLSWLAMALVVIGLAAFYYGNYSAPHVPDGKRWAFGYIMPLAIFVVGGWMCFSAANERSAVGSAHRVGGLAWQEWNPGKVKQTLSKTRRAVWVDYTAHW